MKKYFFLLYVIVLIHISFTLYFLHTNQLAQHNEARDKFIQKIANVVHLWKATPKANRQKALSVFDDRALTVTLSSKPMFSTQFDQNGLWKIVSFLEKTKNTFALSVQMNPSQWINIKGIIIYPIVITQFIWIAAELIVITLIILILWSINRFAVPLKKIKSSAEALGIDLTIKPLDVYGPKPIQEVSEALNQMQNRIFQLIQNRTQLLAAISHDLRTPIMRAQLRLQFIEDSNHKTNLLNDLSEMDKMITESLSFAYDSIKSESQVLIDLVSLLSSICDDANDMGHDVELHTHQHRVAFVGRPIALKRAFTNLINNAVRYAGHASVKIDHQKHTIISIEDNGPGIPESDLEKIFEPFYRGEYSRSKNTGGVGLGLSVTKDIILAHQGKIKLRNKKTGGLKVVVEFFSTSVRIPP